jgi:choice-of-anchor B domain-containing protein
LATTQNPGGVAVVDISTPESPKEVAHIKSTGNSPWQELTGAGNHIYKVSQENTDGIQIISMAPLNEGNPPVLIKNNTAFFKNAHMISSDTTVKPFRLFVAYEGMAGVKIFSLEDPENPRLLRTMASGAHDMLGRGNRLYVSDGNAGTTTIWDITNVETQAPIKVSVIKFSTVNSGLQEPARSFAHNAWPSDDGKVLFTTEETEGCSVKAFDISNISISNPPGFLGKYLAPGSQMAHNAYVKGSILVLSHYTSGVRMVDISDPKNMKEVAYHKVSASNEAFGGSWGAFPWFP